MTKNILIRFKFRQNPHYSPENAACETYEVEVIQAPGRGWGGPMTTTAFEEQHLYQLRQQYRGYIDRQQKNGRSHVPETEIHLLRQLGNQLFNLFPDTIQNRLYQAQQIAREKGCNLEIQFIFEKSAYTLLNLPWELLHLADNKIFLGLQGGGIARQLLLPTTSNQIENIRPRQILGVWAEPAGLQPLTDRQKSGPSPINPAGIYWIQGPNTLKQLQTHLDEGDFDGLHLVAHGRSGIEWDLGLALANEQGEPYWLGGDELATILNQYPQIRFVYLDVCSAGNHITHEEDEMNLIHGGVAPYILGSGVAAVVVMKAEIGQLVSGKIASTFYESLAKGQNIATALTTARRITRLQLGDYIHWSIPALYSQHKNTTSSNKLADYLLEINFMAPLFGLGLPVFTLLALIVGLSVRLTAAYGDFQLTSALLVESNLITLLASMLTTHWQTPLQQKYNLQGQAWIPILLHKYFSACIWVFGGEWFVWLIWLTLAWGGFDTSTNLQYFWMISLTWLAFLAHIGATQATKQQFLFLRVSFSLFKNNIWDIGLVIIVSLLIPLIPFGLGTYFAYRLAFIPTNYAHLLTSLMLFCTSLFLMHLYRTQRED